MSLVLKFPAVYFNFQHLLSKYCAQVNLGANFLLLEIQNHNLWADAFADF